MWDDRIGGKLYRGNMGVFRRRLHEQTVPPLAVPLKPGVGLRQAWPSPVLRGPKFIFESEWGGFFNTYAKGSAQPHLLTENLGSEYRNFKQRH